MQQDSEEKVRNEMTQVQYAEFIDEIFSRVGGELGIRWRAPENPRHILQRGDWSRDFRNGYIVEVRRKGYEPQEIAGLAADGLDPKSADQIETELRNVLSLFLEIWEPAYWSLRFPINRGRFETAHGEWLATLERGPILAAENDLALFDLSFAQIGGYKAKSLGLFIPLADLSEDPRRNLEQLRDSIRAFLESDDSSARVVFLNSRFERRD
ncbi:MAG TPA: hypothetical protein DC047_18075 [Blastocatellia bacterium]|nr:hypothetical protein [Blastocatellia bacterium]